MKIQKIATYITKIPEVADLNDGFIEYSIDRGKSQLTLTFEATTVTINRLIHIKPLLEPETLELRFCTMDGIDCYAIIMGLVGGRFLIQESEMRKDFVNRLRISIIWNISSLEAKPVINCKTND